MTIDAAESGRQAELSCAYSYKPEMRPGRRNAESYDGVMRDIVGNHVCLCDRSRIGAETSIAADQALSDRDFLRTFPQAARLFREPVLSVRVDR